MTTDEIRALLHRSYEAYDKADHAFIVDLFHDDIVWTFNIPPEALPFPNRVTGKIAVLAALQRIGEAIEGVSTKLEVVVAGVGWQRGGAVQTLMSVADEALARAESRGAFEEIDAALGDSLSRTCFEGTAEQLALTETTQPAILAASVAASVVTWIWFVVDPGSLRHLMDRVGPLVSIGDVLVAVPAGVLGLRAHRAAQPVGETETSGV